MNSRERLELTLKGAASDCVPFVPSIYEHGAAVLGKSPGEVSRDAGLMAQAAIESYRRYQHDLVTVGIDIYNIEAEAWGCKLSGGEGTSIPGVISHPLAEDTELNPLRLPEPVPGEGNRLNLFVDAVEKVFGEIGKEVWVYGCLGGPFSQAVELRGFDNLIMDMYTMPDRVHALMERLAQATLHHARRVSEQGAGIYLYESWATSPLITTDIFREYVTPWNKIIVQAVKSNYDTPPPAVIMGGNITQLADLFMDMGVSLVAADYLTDFGVLREKFAGQNIIVRGCVDPKMIERGDWDSIETMVTQLREKSQGMYNFVWGCGCVSYATSAEHLNHFREICNSTC
jgi:uroporphyrinogen decarboxylase